MECIHAESLGHYKEKKQQKSWFGWKACKKVRSQKAGEMAMATESKPQECRQCGKLKT